MAAPLPEKRALVVDEDVQATAGARRSGARRGTDAGRGR